MWSRGDPGVLVTVSVNIADQQPVEKLSSAALPANPSPTHSSAEDVASSREPGTSLPNDCSCARTRRPFPIRIPLIPNSLAPKPSVQAAQHLLRGRPETLGVPESTRRWNEMSTKSPPAVRTTVSGSPRVSPPMGVTSEPWRRAWAGPTERRAPPVRARCDMSFITGPNTRVKQHQCGVRRRRTRLAQGSTHRRPTAAARRMQAITS